jgi:hypothetical protein
MVLRANDDSALQGAGGSLEGVEAETLDRGVGETGFEGPAVEGEDFVKGQGGTVAVVLELAVGAGRGLLVEGTGQEALVAAEEPAVSVGRAFGL